MSAKSELVQANTQPAVTNPDRLLELAVEKGADVDQLSKLMDLRDRWQAQQAKVAFGHALARFQAKCPSMERKSELKHGKEVISRYASLDEISTTIQPIMEGCGLTKSYEIEDTNGQIQVGCRITHVDGHSEITRMSGEPDTSGSKNAIQARASTVSYLMRYTLVGALGITSADDDDDGKASGEPLVHRLLNHQKALRRNIKSVFYIKEMLSEEPPNYEGAAEAMAEINREDRLLLRLRPTKGGIWETEEMNKMHTKEWAQAITLFGGEPAPGELE